MTQTPEGRTKDRIKRILKRHGVHFNMPVPSGFGESTVDFIGARPDDGRAFAIEAKAHKKHPNDRQKKYIRDMRAAGWVVFVIDDERDGLKLNYQSCHELEAWLLEPWLTEVGV